MNLFILILSLPTENATVRQRAWRALKTSGAAVLRDGVYLMPARDACRATLEGVAADVVAGGGSAQVFRAQAINDTDFTPLFNRDADYAALLAEIDPLRQTLSPATAQDTVRQARRLRKAFISLAGIDFFPGEAQRQTDHALSALEKACTRALSPDEPLAQDGLLPGLAIADYQGRTWATRARPWVDRLASAWLIRRYIDPNAHILWLDTPADCPAGALGFDFDGAAFTHVGGRVTFETLLSSFGLETRALLRLGGLVHFLDVGGIQPPEADGIERVLAGLRAGIADDDLLLAAANTLFDGLLTAFETTSPLPGPSTP